MEVSFLLDAQRRQTSVIEEENKRNAERGGAPFQGILPATFQNHYLPDEKVMNVTQGEPDKGAVQRHQWG